jgi:two-component system NtrC family sensor kinase
MTIEALKHENRRVNKAKSELRASFDELLALQHLSHTISTTRHPEEIVQALIELTKQIIPVIASNIFLIHAGEEPQSLVMQGASQLNTVVRQQLDEGIIDWVIAEKKVAIVPNLEMCVVDGCDENYVIVPLFIRTQAIGTYVVHTSKKQEDFTHQDLQLLMILANQAAVAVENALAHEELIRVNKELSASHAQIVQSAKLAAVGELATGVIHEINNPLQILLAHLQLLELGRDVPRRIEIITEQVDRISRITKRLTNFVHSIPAEFTIGSVDVNAAIDEMLLLCTHQLQRNQIEVQRVFENTLTIPGNKAYLQQAFLNVIMNVRDAMPNGGTLTIETKALREQNQVSVRFIDTGVGIPPEHLDRIFSPFFTTKAQGKGIGLGLSVCAGIVSRHKGEIKVSSDVGKGTTLTILLPIERTSA